MKVISKSKRKGHFEFGSSRKVKDENVEEHFKPSIIDILKIGTSRTYSKRNLTYNVNSSSNISKCKGQFKI